MMLSVTRKNGWTHIHDGGVLEDPEAMCLATFKEEQQKELLATLLAEKGRGSFKFETYGNNLILVYRGSKALSLLPSIMGSGKPQVEDDYMAINCNKFYLPDIIETLRGLTS